MNQPSSPRRLWNPRSICILLLAWLVLQLGGLFRPGLLDDVDSVYIQIAREMLQRHNFITPTIDGIRFFDKPPLMYWMAAASMRIFGVHDWAARLPLALGVLVLLFAVYALGIRLFSAISPDHAPDRAGLYAALAMATSIGPYLYTRFYIPDILVALWMTLSVHLFLIALDRIDDTRKDSALSLYGFDASKDSALSGQGFDASKDIALLGRGFSPADKSPLTAGALAPEGTPSPLLPMLGFAAVLALSVLTKGLIGLIFPVLFALLYLAFTHNLKALAKLHLLASTAFFLLLAAPWHILAALQNPPIAMPSGVGLPARAGWAWFYLYNEHIARFLGRRIPHDYGQVPIPIFWLLLILWLIPWAAFLPAALRNAIHDLRHRSSNSSLRFDSDADLSHLPPLNASTHPSPGAPFTRFFFAHKWGPQNPRAHEAALSLLLWPAIILGFFTLSSRQEYYHLPALPALALLVGALLAAADLHSAATPDSFLFAQRQVLFASRWFLVPLGLLLFFVCGYFALTAPTPPHGADLYSLLTSNPADYNLSLGHLFDLTGRAMGFFRGPLLTVSLCMLILGPGTHLLRRRGRTFVANLLLAAAMTGVLLAAHEGLARFYPILGSKQLALDIAAAHHPGDIVAIDGELTSGSTLLFYIGQPVLLVNGRVNGPWFGSFWPDAPHIFLDNAQLHHLWAGPHRIFLLTYHPLSRIPDLEPFGPVAEFAHSGGKTVLTNQK